MANEAVAKRKSVWRDEAVQAGSESWPNGARYGRAVAEADPGVERQKAEWRKRARQWKLGNASKRNARIEPGPAAGVIGNQIRLPE